MGHKIFIYFVWLLGVVGLNAATAASSWFAEDASTFAADVRGENWSYPSSGTTCSAGVLTTSLTNIGASIRYDAPATAAARRVFDVRAQFATPSFAGAATQGGVIGVIRANATTNAAQTVLWVLDPMAGSWRETAYVATGDAFYDIRITVESGAAVYEAAQAGEARETIATVALPVDAVLPSSVSFSGVGSVASLAGAAEDAVATQETTETAVNAANAAMPAANAALAVNAVAANDASVNRATISKDVAWDEIAWESGAFNAGLATELTLTRDARIDFTNQVKTTISQKLTIKGGHTAQLVYTVQPSLSTSLVAAETGSAWEIVIPVETDFPTTTAYTFPLGVTYVIEGSSNKAYPREWKGAVTVKGPLATTGYVYLEGANTIPEGGSLDVRSGSVQFTMTTTQAIKGHVSVAAGAAFVNTFGDALYYTGKVSQNIDIRGTLNLGAYRWSLGAYQNVTFYAGASAVGAGSSAGALDFYQLGKLSVRAAEGADEVRCETPVRLRTAVAIDIDEGVRFVFADHPILYESTTPALSFKQKGTCVFEGADYVINLQTNAGVIEVASDATLSGVAAGKEGAMLVKDGGKLKLTVTDEQLITGYFASSVTLESGNIIFVDSAGTEHAGTGNVLKGTADMWIGAGDGYSWGDKNNWSLGIIPTAQRVVIFSSAACVTLDASSVCKELRLQSAANVVFSNETGSCTLTTDSVTFESGAAIGKAGAGTVTLDLPLGTSGNAFSGGVTLAGGTLAFARDAFVSGAVTGAGSLALAQDVAVTLTGAATWTGATTLGAGATLKLPGDVGPMSSLTGASTSVIQLNGLTIDGAYTASSLLSAAAWQGVVWLRGATFKAGDFSKFARNLRLTGCSGYLPHDSTFDKSVALVDEGTTRAFTITGGDAGYGYAVNSLTGEGTLAITNALSGYAFICKDASGFGGNVLLDAAGNNFGVYFGSHSKPYEGYGKITVVNDASATVGSNAVWRAVNGIEVAERGALTVRGTLGGAVIGRGRVTYVGELNNAKVEAAAAFTDSAWQGTVAFAGCTFQNVRLDRAGHANSTIVLSGCTGTVYSATIPAKVVLEGEGLTLGLSAAKLVFDNINGSAPLALDTGSYAAVCRLADRTNYSGKLTIADGSKGAIVLGEDIVTKTSGAIHVPDGATLKSGCGWSAPKYVFGKTLYVDGKVGDVLMRASDQYTSDLKDLTVTLLPESAPIYRLNVDAFTKDVYVAVKTVEPTVNVSGVRLVYGTDMTNASVRLDISDFWAGSGYDSIVAQVYIRDATGKAVGAVGTTLTHEGEIDVGTVDLFQGQGGDYTYEVHINAYETKYSDPLELDRRITAASVTHQEGVWISEDATSFASAVKTEKTGDWSWNTTEPIAFVKEGIIRIETSNDDGEQVLFAPYRESSNDVVTVKTRFLANGDITESQEISANAQAAIAIMKDGVSGICFGVLNPSSGALEHAYGSGTFVRPRLNTWYDVTYCFNYDTGRLSYSINDSVLTNAAGESFFALTEAQKAAAKLHKMRFQGYGSVDTMTGEEENANLAAVEGKQYRTMSAAIDAAKAAGVKDVELLWDASWKPSVADLGHAFRFTGDHTVYIDPAATNAMGSVGYAVTYDPSTGTYKVDLITYYLTFAENAPSGDASGEETQPYWATNLVFKLRKNTFEQTGYDFAAWNLAADGSGMTNWADEATIDMTPYGLTNMTLHAQWHRAVRAVVVEASDPSVYIELVQTNGVKHAGVVYYASEDKLKAGQGLGRAEIPVEMGSDLVITYSTDIEKHLLEDFDHLSYYKIDCYFTVKASDQPKLESQQPASSAISPLTLWAYRKGIAPSLLAKSAYSQASYALNANTLLNEKSQIVISDFVVTEDGCTFRVSADGYALTSSALAAMVGVSNDLTKPWSSPASEDVTIDASGLVHVRLSTPAAFIRITIPKND